jgi:hypothetical protein
MPKKIIYLDRRNNLQQYVLWASVPSGQESRYANPEASSAYQAASDAEIDAIRKGQVAETVGTISTAGLTEAEIEARLIDVFNAYQAAVTAGADWAFYGKNWDGTTWTPGGPSTVPAMTQQTEDALPTWVVMTPVSGYAVNKFHFVLYNNTTFYIIRIRLLVYKPDITAVTGALPSPFTLRRRKNPTTAPVGGLVTPIAVDTAQVALPSGITAHNAPTTAPAGGTAEDILVYQPQADEIKLSSLDAPTFASLLPFGGAPIWKANEFAPALPLILRPGEVLELQQGGATAGTGSCRILAVFTVKDAR